MSLTSHPFFSIIIATYNRGQHILPTIQSVLAQEFQDFELLIVGDCCTDQTAEVVKPLLNARIRWFNLAERFESQSGPNNFGIQKAQGSHIAYLGHDDIWAPDHLTELARVFKESKPSFAISGAILHSPPGINRPIITGMFENSEAALQHFFPPSSLAHTRAVVEQIGTWKNPYECSAPVDADFLLRAAQAGLKFVSTNKLTVHKFTAAQRYLSYLKISSDEQTEMLKTINSDNYRQFLEECLSQSKTYDQFMALPYVDFSKFTPGQIARENHWRRGLKGRALKRFEICEFIAEEKKAMALDWTTKLSNDLRWVGVNPLPQMLIPYTGDVQVNLSILFAHRDPRALEVIECQVSDLSAQFAMGQPFKVDEHYECLGVLSIHLDRQAGLVLKLILNSLQKRSEQAGGIGYSFIFISEKGDGEAQRYLDEAISSRKSRPVKTFAEADYLEVNPDVRAALERGEFPSGEMHYRLHGHFEGRSLG
ncbi:glycosyltransferase [bacterium]|nr:glycosyltransferase [bacterium]